MNTKTRQRLTWRLYNGRHVVVDRPELVSELREVVEGRVLVTEFLDRRDRRMKFRIVKLGA